jgi:lipopolysaccharide biosynthesis protein
MKAIAFYLPQLHPIPENGRWWGVGFFGWTHVARARPLCRNRHQPHILAGLVFYDLRSRRTPAAHAAMAQHGKLLMEKPAKAMLEDRVPDSPSGLCWAKETWNLRWDGREHEVPMRKTYVS